MSEGNTNLSNVVAIRAMMVVPPTITMEDMLNLDNPFIDVPEKAERLGRQADMLGWEVRWSYRLQRLICVTMRGRKPYAY